jgi:peptidoglycan/xylan/chitin deacetylase (PgdA/CDA1 family)
MEPVPILVYHSVSADPPGWIRPFSVAPALFRRQLDAIVASGASTLSVSQFANAIAQRIELPHPTVVITFDDGFADFASAASPALGERGLTATLYVTTGFLGGLPDAQVADRPRGPWLEASELPELRAQGFEIGAHTHTHPQLDTLELADAQDEIERCKRHLENALDEEVRSFAYPHGYSDPPVRELVRDAGFESACACKNAFSSVDDNPYELARLMVRRTTSPDQIRRWVHGHGPRTAPFPELARTTIWRRFRRTRAKARRLVRSGSPSRPP